MLLAKNRAYFVRATVAVQFMPLLAISPAFFTSVYSRYHQAVLTFDRTAQLLISWQHFTFLPLLCVAKFGEQILCFALFSGSVLLSPVLCTIFVHETHSRMITSR